MTKRESLNTIAIATATAENMPAELVEFAPHELDVMTATEDAEKESIRNAIMDVMTNEPQTATMLIEAAGLTDTVEPQSIHSLLKPLIEAGTLEKKGTQNGYKFAE